MDSFLDVIRAVENDNPRALLRFSWEDAGVGAKGLDALEKFTIHSEIR